MYYKKFIDTPLGIMHAISDEKVLLALFFDDSGSAKQQALSMQSDIMTMHPVLLSIENEIRQYFDGTLHLFQTPMQMLGTDFQKNIWSKILLVPYGCVSYYFNPYRASGNATAANMLSIIVPCHRIVSKNGSVGYNAGVTRKNFLLSLEARYMKTHMPEDEHRLHDIMVQP